MTGALDADVTPQTVRRNMITHGIHEPESRGGEADDPDRGGSGDGTPDGEEPARSGAVETAGGDEPTRPDRGETPSGEGTATPGSGGRADGGGTAPSGPGEAPGRAGTTIDDGVDLPSGTTIGDLKTVVASARTLHEVQRELGVDRERARGLLAELDLLDVVAGRLAGEREITPEEIEPRIEAATPSGA